MKTIPIYLSSEENTRHECFAFQRQKEQEIIISLFTECNLACSFCGDRARELEKFSVEGLQLRLNNLEKIIKSGILNNVETISIKLFGGELFQDKFDDSVFDKYSWFITRVEQLLYDKKVEWAVSTNFVFKKYQRVFDWLKKHNIDLRCSFDFEGRYTKPWQLECFLNNLKLAKENSLSPKIAIVLTKSVILSIKNRAGLYKVFEQLYKDYLIAFDYYDDITLIPKDEAIKQIGNPLEFNLTEEDIGQFLVDIKDQFPLVENIIALRQSLQQDKQHQHCSHGLTITHKIYWECCNMDAVYKEFIKNKQCFNCQYYAQCLGTCNRIFYRNAYCHLKHFYDAISKE